MIEVTEAPNPAKKTRKARPKTGPEPPILHSESAPEPVFSDQEESETPETPFDGAPAEPFPPIQPRTNFENLTDYWNNRLTPAQRRQGTVYLYRLQPKMLLVPGRGGRLVNGNCEKFNEGDGPITRDLIRKRRRMGVYLLRLSQRAVKPTCEISNCEVEIHGDMTDPNDMPILDVQGLDLSYEGNRDYVQLLRSRGIIKADANGPDGEGVEDMAASEVLGNIAGRAIDVLSEQRQQQPPQQQVQASGDGVGKELVGLLREQINQSRPVEQQGTVLDMVKALNEIAAANRPDPPAPPDLKPFMELQKENNQLVREMMQKDVERAQAEAARAREEVAAFKASLPVPKTVMEQIRELKEASKAFQEMSGRKVKDDEESDEDKKAAANPVAAFSGIFAVVPTLIDKGLEFYKLKTINDYNAKLAPGQSLRQVSICRRRG